MRNQSDISLAQELSQAPPSFEPTRLRQFRRIQAAQPNAFGAVANRVAIHCLHLPTLEVPGHEAKLNQ
jgi:hypothetical protein